MISRNIVGTTMPAMYARRYGCGLMSASRERPAFRPAVKVELSESEVERQHPQPFRKQQQSDNDGRGEPEIEQRPAHASIESFDDAGPEVTRRIGLADRRHSRAQ